MKKDLTVCVFGFPAWGHVIPTNSVIKSLIKLNYKVIVYNHPEFKQTIENSGAVFKEYPDFKNLKVGVNFQDKPEKLVSLWGYSLLSYSYHHKNWFEDELQKINPAAVFHDCMAVWARRLTHSLSEKWVGIYPILATDLETYKHYKYLNAILFQTLLNYPILWIKILFEYLRVMVKYQQIFNILEIASNFEDQNICLYSEILQPKISDNLRSKLFFAGPQKIGLPNISEFDHTILEAKPVIYVTLGTFFPADLPLYKIIFDSLSDLDFKILVPVGKNRDLLTDKLHIPKNVILADKFPQSQLMKVTKLIISNGGLGTLSDATKHNIPTIVIPSVTEQYLNAKIFNSLYCSSFILRNKIKKSKFRRLVIETLSNPHQSTVLPQNEADLKTILKIVLNPKE